MRHRGSSLGASYELRITQRCLSEDLGFSPTSSFEDAATHPMVEAFENQRHENPLGTKKVGPDAGQRSVYRLGSGHHHRGATWFDDSEEVVWLCAYRLHRSGEADDAFPFFRELIDSDRMLPGAEDYEALYQDRGHRFAETVSEEAQQLLHEARLVPGIEVRDIIGGEENVGVLVEVVETLEELYLAFSLRNMGTERIVVILAAFAPTTPFSDWELADYFPTRDLDLGNAEICYRLLKD